MITAPSSYEELLSLIQSSNIRQQAIQLPAWVDGQENQEKFFETIYNINLNSRIIEYPKVITIEADHNAEALYFKFDRYFGFMDLANTFCVIEYINADSMTSGKYVYRVPYYDTTTLSNENKIVIEWDLEESVTRKSGKVVFAIKFFILDMENLQYNYTLNTLPSYLNISKGLDNFSLNDDYYTTDGSVMDTIGNQFNAPNALEALIQKVNTLVSDNTIYWTEI